MVASVSRWSWHHVPVNPPLCSGAVASTWQWRLGWAHRLTELALKGLLGAFHRLCQFEQELKLLVVG